MGFGIDFAVRIRPPADATEASGAVGEFFWDGAADTLFWVDPKNKITAVLSWVLFAIAPALSAIRASSVEAQRKKVAKAQIPYRMVAQPSCWLMEFDIDTNK